MDGHPRGVSLGTEPRLQAGSPSPSPTLTAEVWTHGGHQMTDATLLAALVPVMIVSFGIVIYALVDLSRTPEPAHLPRWAWVIISLVSMPLGAIAYLVWGRPRR